MHVDSLSSLGKANGGAPPCFADNKEPRMGKKSTVTHRDRVPITELWLQCAKAPAVFPTHAYNVKFVNREMLT